MYSPLSTIADVAYVRIEGVVVELVCWDVLRDSHIGVLEWDEVEEAVFTAVQERRERPRACFSSSGAEEHVWVVDDCAVEVVADAFADEEMTLGKLVEDPLAQLGGLEDSRDGICSVSGSEK